MVQQLDLFVRCFDPDTAKWEAREYNPSNIECEAYIIIPQSVKSPLEENTVRGFQEERNRKLDIWNAYVWAILWAIPREVKKDEDDFNGWRMAYQLLENHRESEMPIRVLIQHRSKDLFLNAVLVNN